MLDWLGVDHLFELSTTEAIAGFFTPLAIFAAFFLAQMVLPGRWVPGYVVNSETGEPRQYRLNGILVFALAMVVWALELTGMPRDWFLPVVGLCRGRRDGVHPDLRRHHGLHPTAGRDQEPAAGALVRAGPKSCRSSSSAST